ncbi:beta-L-arabinofuranosidase domain-containing protein [Microscilla marina]|uniref:Glycosyl hydrolase n=1 Tax=Microscilla marina ATCC 23134 TaxID=313606 RepID=A1ZWA7_MICM2|nr:beta-L-arabinofuranosidase domain-containing protein [Microscilla marina]EAY25345.1 conserved hypothetical protein [Microscilla marina ATCC 23134]
MSENPFKLINTVAQKYEWLAFGHIKPKGWVLEQMQRDLTDGFLGKLDELVPELTKEDDIYGQNRLSKNVKSKDLGNKSEDKKWEVQYLWWNSETQSNWRDGYIRAAVLTSNQAILEKVQKYVEHILSCQDPDGYLGIYDRELRYNFDNENGELWAQACLLRGLLAYYEATQEQKVLNAVVKAVRVTMQAYPPHASNPFGVKASFAGVGHGLIFTDVVDRLYQLTKEKVYLEYSLWLYENYSQNTLSEQDIQYKNAINPAYKFKGHGVHTYEHIRALVTAYYASGNPSLKKALGDYLTKLEKCITPSGGPVGDEWVAERYGDATETGYEYCSIHELLDSYTHLLQKTGDMQWADKAEWLLFNAAQGARHPQESCIAYLKTDNSYAMVGKFRPGDVCQEGEVEQVRYKYSPTHQDAAVCCNPNAGRIYPYYVKSMWLRSQTGLVAALYGASVLDTEINGISLKIEQKTNYPFEQQIAFELTLDQPQTFEFCLRQPAWATGAQIHIEGSKATKQDQLWVIHKQWETGDVVTVNFEAKVEVRQDQKQDCYLSYGSLLYALPIKAERTVHKSHPVEGFYDLYYTTNENINYYFDKTEAGKFEHQLQQVNTENPWGDPASLLKGKLWNTQGQLQEVTLWPLGSTILRRVTFEPKPLPEGNQTS